MFINHEGRARRGIAHARKHRKHHVVGLGHALVQVAGERHLDVIRLGPRLLRERAWSTLMAMKFAPGNALRPLVTSHISAVQTLV